MMGLIVQAFKPAGHVGMLGAVVQAAACGPGNFIEVCFCADPKLV